MLSTSVPKPGRSRYGPLCPQPETRTITRRGLRACSTVRAEPHFFERPGPEILDQHLARRGQIEQQIAPARLAQAQRDALLVARIEFPVDADPAALPGAQRIALYRVLDLDDLRPEIGELRGHRVAGDEPRQIDDPDTVERADQRRYRTIFRADSSAALVTGRQSGTLAAPRREENRARLRRFPACSRTNSTGHSKCVLPARKGERKMAD